MEKGRHLCRMSSWLLPTTHLPASPSSEASMIPDTWPPPSYLELRSGCRRGCPSARWCIACFPVITQPLSAAQRSPCIMSLGDSDHVICFVMAVKSGVITWSRCVARDPVCGTGSARHRDGHCCCPKSQATCSEVAYKSHCLPPLSRVTMPY